MKRFWQEFCRDWHRILKVGPSFERLARFKAWQMNGKKLLVVEIQPWDKGCFIRVVDIYSTNYSFVIWTNRPVKIRNGSVQVKYRREPEENLVAMYGRFGYCAKPAAYLTVAS